ncbi:MAG TPA: phosphatase PAP2 family protein [Acidimicrobiales bacterium]|jgi:hypothetical protein|nr:phosphatase PAP2 family protein [Acidimicrobiales bacterium]
MAGADVSGPLPLEPVARGRPRWWTQVLLVATVWWTYDAINNLNPLRAATALGHGLSILSLETTLHAAPERWLNSWLAHHLSVGRWLGDYYDVAHFVVTIAVLVWVWSRHADRYRPLRNALLGINLIGFVVYWAYPVAPPRLLDGKGFVDIVAVTHSIGAWSSGRLASQANEYAAMPSLHIAWALWCALAVWCVRKDRPARAAAAAYPIFTSLAVMATANHYFLDVVAGAATALVAAAPMMIGAYRAARPPVPAPPPPRAAAAPTAVGPVGPAPVKAAETPAGGRSASSSRRRRPSPPGPASPAPSRAPGG